MARRRHSSTKVWHRQRPRCIALVTLLVVRRLLYYSCLGMFSRWTGDEGGREMKVHGTCTCNLLITKQKKSGPPVHNVVLITVRSTASWHWQVTPSINPAIPQLPYLLSLDVPMTFLMLFVQRFYIPRQRHFRRRQLGLLIVEHG